MVVGTDSNVDRFAGAARWDHDGGQVLSPAPSIETKPLGCATPSWDRAALVGVFRDD
jgi:hypothetical protein